MPKTVLRVSYHEADGPEKTRLLTLDESFDDDVDTLVLMGRAANALLDDIPSVVVVDVEIAESESA